MLHFSLAFPICSSRFFVAILDVGIASICDSFDNILLFLLLRMGTLWAHNLLFSIVNEIYEYDEARSVISLFQMNELFSHHFRGFKLKIFDPRNSCNPIRFPALSNEYVNDCQYDLVLCPNTLIY